MLRPRSTPPNLFAACFLALALSGCGDGFDSASVTRMIRLGQFDRAEAALVGAEGERAAELRAHIAQRREALAGLEQELLELEELDPRVAVKLLRERAEGESDPVARERLESALSRAVDRRASGVAGRPHKTASFVPTLPVEAERERMVQESLAPVERDAGRDADLLEGVVERVQAELLQSEWARAIAELDMSFERAGPRVAELRALRDEARQDAQAEARELATLSAAAAGLESLQRERQRLERELGRFPSGAGMEILRDAMDTLGERAAVLRSQEIAAAEAARRATRPSNAPRPGASSPSGAAALEGDEALAFTAEQEGDLEGAVELWLEAAFDHPPGADRDAAVARARGLERRLTTRKEVVAAFEREPAAFEELGLTLLDLRTLTVAGNERGWSEMPIDWIVRAVRAADPSREAELGLLSERIARGNVEGTSGALAEVQRMLERKKIDEAEAWALVAQARGENVPERGYAFANDRWTPRAEAELTAAREDVARLEKKLTKAKPAQREALLDELVAIGEVAMPAAERAMQARFEAAVRDLSKNKTLDQLERLMAQRRELDDKRAIALELIFDEEEYFYPYRPPEVPADKAKLYWPVQQRVDGLVAAVREIWDAPREVKLSSSFRDALDEIAWLRAEGRVFELSFPLPDGLPEWVDAIDPGAGAYGLHEFAWNLEEAEQVAYDRAVRARNERLFDDQDELTDEQQSSSGEQTQVRITNDYRLMFGRRALAWNPLIQAAAEMHSDYMANTGDFGHFEPDPERRTPGDRMRLAGYTFGVGENCAMSGGDPESPHHGWTHSSGHHRNLLNPGHREMASAVASRYWTQNFGVDRTFVGELEAWQD